MNKQHFAIFLAAVCLLTACATDTKSAVVRPNFVKAQHKETAKLRETGKTTLEVGWGEIISQEKIVKHWYASSDEYQLTIVINSRVSDAKSKELVESIIKNFNYADEGINVVGDYNDGLTVVKIGRHPQDAPTDGLAIAIKVLKEAGFITTGRPY